jgi:hypothetical protein
MDTKRTSSTQAVKQMSAKEIAEKAMPGWKAVSSEALPDAPEAVEADAQLPPLEVLRKKYLGDAASDALDAEGAEDGTNTEQVVTLQSGLLKRKVGVNIQQGVVTWRQG